MTRQEFFDARMADCKRGFRDHFHHTGWKKKWKRLIGSWLPPHMAAQIWVAHEQATWDGYSKGAQSASGSPPEAK